jgi:hypothetical protein
MIEEIIFKLYPQVSYVNAGIAYDKNQKVVEINQSLVDAEFAKIAYIGKRAIEYPSIVDQLDTLYHGGYDAWKATIQAVKDKYPKEQA